MSSEGKKIRRFTGFHDDGASSTKVGSGGCWWLWQCGGAGRASYRRQKGVGVDVESSSKLFVQGMWERRVGGATALVGHTMCDEVLGVQEGLGRAHGEDDAGEALGVVGRAPMALGTNVLSAIGEATGAACEARLVLQCTGQGLVSVDMALGDTGLGQTDVQTVLDG
ncbi:unnamed protein product [Ilex paraguariensis]|uniref:Uncharacterized protein n=1 Tax=Ilex paraguariensis TaxID=185542 RepID=A0ABC8S7K2_9AQUA